MALKKNTKSIAALILVTLLIAACGTEEQRSSVRRGGRAARNAGVASPDQAAYQSGTWAGIVYGSPQNLFQDATKDFVSSFMNPQDLGTVSGAYNQSTGIRFDARVQSNVLAGDNLSALSITGGSLDLLIFDSAAQSGAAEAIVVATPEFSRASMNGSWLDLQFSDDYAYIGIQGYISGSNFVGEIRFRNKVHFDGGTPAAWDLWGGISIPKCQIFRCN